MTAHAGLLPLLPLFADEPVGLGYCLVPDNDATAKI